MANSNMTDKEYNDIIYSLAIHIRLKVVKALLSGNDAGCFSTDNYIDKYVEIAWHNKNNNPYYNYQRIRNHVATVARTHLQSISSVVREVKPDVWAGV